MSNTAFIFNTIPPILQDDGKKNIYVIVLADSPAEVYARENYSGRVIAYKETSHSTKEYHFLSHSDLTERLREHDITQIISPHRYSKTLNNWAFQQGLKIIGPPPDLQMKMEDKLFFDSLLKKNEIPSPPTVSIDSVIDNQTYVVQTAASYGMFGTYFCQGKDELTKIVGSHRKKVLIRPYIQSISYGVTMILDQSGSFIISGLRRQCFTFEQGYPRTFVGVQWMRSDFFPEKVQRSIGVLLQQLAAVFTRAGFYGMANFDILIRDDEVYCIECNPRLSSASPQLFSVAHITNTEDPWACFIAASTGNVMENLSNRHMYSTYEGALMDIDVVGVCQVVNVPQIGVYSWEKNRLNYISNRYADIQQGEYRFFLIHTLRSKANRFSDDTFCTIISHTPLFDAQSGERNNIGELITHYLFDTCLKK